MMLGINDKIPRGKVLQWYRALMIDVFQTNLISFLRWFFLSFLKFFISNSFLNKTTPLITSVWKSEAFNLNIKERKRERERERERIVLHNYSEPKRFTNYQDLSVPLFSNKSSSLQTFTTSPVSFRITESSFVWTPTLLGLSLFISLDLSGIV